MDPERDLELDGGMLKDKADLRWPLPVVAADGGVNPAFAFDLPARDAPSRFRSDCACDCCPETCRDCPGSGATFLKVMVHLISSPENTVWSCQRTKTRMLVASSDGAIDVGGWPSARDGGGARAAR